MTTTEPLQQQLHSPVPTLAGSPRTILLVDDEQSLREMIAEFLGDMGYIVHEASNGAEALEYYTAHRAGIDLVLTDLFMPDMGGEDLYRHLKAVSANVKVIVSSGGLDGRGRNDLMELGICGVLAKPFKMKDLHKTIHTALGD